MRLSKRAKIVAAATGGVVILIWLLSLIFPGSSPEDRAEALRQGLRERIGQMVRDQTLARDDGYAYAVDIGQLMTFAALSGDRELYDAMHKVVTDHLLVDDPDDPYTAGFVAWRYKVGEPLDASGTTEALRVAEALWIGGERFEQPKDRNLAVRILRGYARHQTIDQGQWMVRNYFNLQTRAFAPNSYLIDYDPDFVAAVAEATDDESLQRVAEQSAKLVQDAHSPAGLLHAVIQPELKTLMPASTPIFSPNNVELLGNVAAVAERSVRSTPADAQRVLDFAMARVRDLKGYYNAATGEAVENRRASVNTLAPLVRLAVKLDDDRARFAMLALLLDRADGLPQAQGRAWLHAAGETLLALHAATGHGDPP